MYVLARSLSAGVKGGFVAEHRACCGQARGMSEGVLYERRKTFRSVLFPTHEMNLQDRFGRCQVQSFGLLMAFELIQSVQ
jgi:hypothetical protein